MLIIVFLLVGVGALLLVIMWQLSELTSLGKTILANISSDDALAQRERIALALDDLKEKLDELKDKSEEIREQIERSK